jgi:aspartyl-tRNA(Asn)/glutamyl-tRNA(Gln) amidotransferase subunit A
MDRRRRVILNQVRFPQPSPAIFPRALAQPASNSGHSMHGRSITDLKRSLSNGSVTSRQLVEDARPAINDPNGEGKASFIKIHAKDALQTADAFDAQRKKGMAVLGQV